MFKKTFAEIITKAGMIPTKDLRPLLQDKDPNTISEFELLKFSFFDDIKFAKQLAENYKLFFINLEHAKIKAASLSLMKRKYVLQYRAIAIQKTKKTITIATYDPSTIKEKNELQAHLQSSIEFILTNLSSWKKIYDHVEESLDDILETVREVKPGDLENKAQKVSGKIKTEDDIGADVIKYVNRILANSFIKKASDIHVEPYEKTFRVRFRIDGKLIVMENPPENLMLPIISRIKIMAQLDISEKRRPQDGRIKLMIGGKPIDYRVSSLPTLFGEKIVLRLLDSSNLQLDMTKLGLEEAQMNHVKEGIHRPFGMCLVTGPTGSGKTTTLYSALYELNKISTNISTAEDPVEFNLEGINQVNIHKEAGLNFATSLKAFLRQDPDIIMVGEIRDQEVAEIAVEAALTGHLVLSTLHTNDACSTITRLINMGVEPFLVSGCLNIVVAQRLCRKICTVCKIKMGVNINELISCGISSKIASQITIYKGKGCESCSNTGYKGRIAIYEVLRITSKLKQVILQAPSAEELKKYAIKDGMKTLRMSALTKVVEGLITLEEAVMNSGSDK